MELSGSHTKVQLLSTINFSPFKVPPKELDSYSCVSLLGSKPHISLLAAIGPPFPSCMSTVNSLGVAILWRRCTTTMSWQMCWSQRKPSKSPLCAIHSPAQKKRKMTLGVMVQCYERSLHAAQVPRRKTTPPTDGPPPPDGHSPGQWGCPCVSLKKGSFWGDCQPDQGKNAFCRPMINQTCHKYTTCCLFSLEKPTTEKSTPKENFLASERAHLSGREGGAWSIRGGNERRKFLKEAFPFC